jgi:hypothetical protein
VARARAREAGAAGAEAGEFGDGVEGGGDEWAEAVDDACVGNFASDEFSGGVPEAVRMLEEPDERVRPGVEYFHEGAGCFDVGNEFAGDGVVVAGEAGDATGEIILDDGCEVDG